MNIEQLKTTPTVKLIDVLVNAQAEQNQFLANIVAWELAVRIYVPNKEKTLEEMAAEFGYVETQPKKQNEIIK